MDESQTSIVFFLKGAGRGPILVEQLITFLL